VPPKQPGPFEPLSTGDRLVSALLGGILAFGTMLVIWFLVLYAGGRTRQDVELPFYWTYVASGIVGVIGFFLGPERMLVVLATVWDMLGRLMFWRRWR
jgi:hypothetical protein